MAVWCGHCQARNEPGAVRCEQCGTLLRPASIGRPRRGVADQAASGRRSREPAPRRFDPRRLARLVEEQYPDRPELRILVGKCRFAVRREALPGGTGTRQYFLPERDDGHLVVPEDRCVLSAPGLTITIAIAKDVRRADRKAVYYVEARPAPVAAPLPAKLARYEQLCQDRRALQRQAGLVTMLVVIATAAIAFISLNNPTPPSGAQGLRLASLAAAAVAAYFALHVYRLSRHTAELDGAIASLEAQLDLAPPAACGAEGSTSGVTPQGALVGLSVGLATFLIWLAARPVATGIQPWEPVVVPALALLAYPVAIASRWLWRRWTVARAARELARGRAAGVACRFEPWVEI